MGLGLHVSRKIVEAHQGTIQAGKSASLGGARFEVRLPRSTTRVSDSGLVVS
jgi:K+-sensing histidine kinase KdpD